MRRPYDKENEKDSKQRKPRGGKRGKQKDKGSDKRDQKKDLMPLMSAENRDNNPNWYFTDAKLADQVSQLSFQQLAGFPLEIFGKEFDVPNIVRILFNPCPGVTPAKDFSNSAFNRTSGLNLAGFRIFSKLSAYTGRIATYGPQDISTMMLAMGEVISCVEFLRRAFGIAFTINMRNRDYPRTILDFGMLIDSDDLFKYFSDYRTRFNSLITMINQLPIPKNVAYFDKCASMYEHVYLDAPSSMAQSLITVPFTTWVLDETSYAGGTVLKTTAWAADAAQNMYYTISTPRTMGDYLDIVDLMVGNLLNSSNLQVVYTDLLNLAVKQGQEFWKLDYLMEGYFVEPVFNLNFSLQMHNATIAGAPVESAYINTSAEHVTPLNDVYPNPNLNSLFYNPAFVTVNNVANGAARTGNEVLIDMLSDNVTVEDRVEVTRYSSVSGQRIYTPTGMTSNTGRTDAVLPDHYVVMAGFRIQDPASPYAALARNVNSTMLQTGFKPACTWASNIDWAPRLYEVDAAGVLTGLYSGDLNFYTTVSTEYLRKLHQFMSLALYDLR